ncbi:hypothetical protein ElyMa_002288900 [Elysia marginata]|uniref:Uncharacterized protein n=1 Tax=Elysia marginata TaxID=1093978 RepID=A0AAV4G2U4_9GAST|nr:hypothetical protein ElyMa_002288900 [Elysia marginata]
MDGTDYRAGGVYIKTNNEEMSLDIAAGRYGSRYRVESVAFHAVLEWLVVENNRVKSISSRTPGRWSRSSTLDYSVLRPSFRTIPGDSTTAKTTHRC